MLCKAGIAPHNHGRYLTRYEQQLATNAASPKTEKQPQTAKRLSGGGRKTALTAEQEAELRAWVMEQRRSEARLAVSEKMVRMEAKRCRFCLADLTRRADPAAAMIPEERVEPRLH